MAVSTESIIVSAPGKIIFHGEHAVVYGKVVVRIIFILECSPFYIICQVFKKTTINHIHVVPAAFWVV